jgi:hypothetical protein
LHFNYSTTRHVNQFPYLLGSERLPATAMATSQKTQFAHLKLHGTGVDMHEGPFNRVGIPYPRGNAVGLGKPIPHNEVYPAAQDNFFLHSKI